MSDFESEDEGSTPSPAATISDPRSICANGYFDCLSPTELVNGEDMFIRFVSGEIDEDSRVSAGLFCAAFELRWADGLPRYELDLLSELRDWFDVHLESPTEYLPSDLSYERAVSWFKPTAREHLARAWALVAILERNDVLIWTLKSPTIGRVYYEDDAQVFAVPSRELRKLCRR